MDHTAAFNTMMYHSKEERDENLAPTGLTEYNLRPCKPESTAMIRTDGDHLNPALNDLTKVQAFSSIESIISCIPGDRLNVVRELLLMRFFVQGRFMNASMCAIITSQRVHALELAVIGTIPINILSKLISNPQLFQSTLMTQSYSSTALYSSNGNSASAIRYTRTSRSSS